MREERKMREGRKGETGDWSECVCESEGKRERDVYSNNKLLERHSGDRRFE
jgi:hypothetical protein